MIKTKGLRFSFSHQASPAIDQIDLDIKTGEAFVLLGPKGAGKTTLVQVLAGLLRGYQGQIQLGTQPLETADQGIYESLGLLSEGHYLRLSVFENLQYFKGFYQGPCRPIDELLDQLGLRSLRDQPAGQLSQGEARRLSLARALLPNPSILLLDQPGQGLEPDWVLQIERLLKTEKEAGKTLFFTADSIDFTAHLADQVGFMAGGKILAQGNILQLLKNRQENPLVLEWEEKGELREARFPLLGLDQNPEFQRLLALGPKALYTQNADLAQAYREFTGRPL